ncbi:MAG: hypothetical protein EPO62_06760 [Candidatus Nitrosotenuis sp.]|nr:MAG: hypothetical protein EPO62_06760 [Candidatus Nitrosotenuis sp.]
MEEEFESVILSCGHAINTNSGLGKCIKCKMNKCGKCLQVIGEHLLCPKCFDDRMREKNE